MEKDGNTGSLGCCACDDNLMDSSMGLTCADKKNIFTAREERVLNKIRESSLRAGALKDKIKGSDERGRESALFELELLRKLRAELEQERLAAAEERMRLLGHL